jgi:hypothetical protein
VDIKLWPVATDIERNTARNMKNSGVRTFGYLSVVVIPTAAGRMEFFCILFAASGTPSPVIAATGNLHPIIPDRIIVRKKFQEQIRAVVYCQPSAIEEMAANLSYLSKMAKPSILSPTSMWLLQLHKLRRYPQHPYLDFLQGKRSISCCLR